MADSAFCRTCGGGGEVLVHPGRYGTAGGLGDDYELGSCPSCGGRGGYGPAFNGSAVPADQAALDIINDAARRRS